jgi:regulator of protease activity HflC (stomatin/prohibitin superfamily)
MYYPLIVLVVIFVLASLRQVNQYERGVKFTMGRFTSVAEPGWRLVVPVFQSMMKVDLRLKAVDVPSQDAITKDNVSAKINAVIYYKVIRPEKAVLEVEKVNYAVLQLAQTTMRNIVGEVTLDELLSQRKVISEKIEKIVDEATMNWGVEVTAVELKDINLPPEMVRTIAKQAEAERERRAVIINAEGEVIAAENLSKAANMLSAAPGALHLRTLNSINDISSDQSNTVVFTLPLEILKAYIGSKDLAALAPKIFPKGE